MKLKANAIEVLKRRYLIRDVEGNIIETPEEMFRRVATAIASAEKEFDKNADVNSWANRYYEMMTELDFLPNSPTLMNAGKDLGQLSACFVLPVGDSMEEIFEAIKQAALIHKSGGGTGFSFTRLRPSGAVVHSTGGVASGPVSFMRVFNMATEAVKQGGTRRGANMGILRCDHPDILDFIDCKKDNADITNFNISIGITEEFMEAVHSKSNYDLIDPHSKKSVGQLSASEVFEKIVMGAYHNGEPGIIFLDRINRDNPVPSQGEIESTNPCGEQPLLPYESCNLGSINLCNMLIKMEDSYVVDYDKLDRTVTDAVRFLDNVISVNKYPIKQIEEVTKKTRKIGLGVMGFADMLLKLKISYNSKEGVQLAETIMDRIKRVGHIASGELAKQRGSFPLFEDSIFKAPMRNATITTIAPTGTLSILAGCSSGVEPVFGYVFVRNIMDGTRFLEVNPVLEEMLVARGLYSEALLDKIIENGSLQGIKELPDDIKEVFVSSHDVSPIYHIQMQSAFQKHTDNAVSKTVNFSHDATIDEVREVFMLAYTLDCKGVTIYRDGSRENQVLNVGKSAPVDEVVPEVAKANSIIPRPRPEVTQGITERMGIGCGNLYVTVNYDENGICEVFTSTGKKGGCPSQSEAAARLTSIALRSGVSIDEIVEQLKGIRCPSTVRRQGMKCTSCPDAIAKVITKVDNMLKAQNGQPLVLPKEEHEAIPNSAAVNNPCPECGKEIELGGGCVFCRNCGYSKCH